MSTPRTYSRWKTATIGALLLLLGIVLGRWVFPSAGHDHAQAIAGTEASTYTCSMHPQIRQNEPGDCPICGMELIPLSSNNDDATLPDLHFQMTERARALAQVEVTEVTSTSGASTVILQGEVAVDQSRRYPQVMQFSGRIEKQQVLANGQFVRAGEVVAEIYSPALANAQTELQQAQRVQEVDPLRLELVKEKLRKWKLSERDIDRLLTGEMQGDRVPVRAEHTGFVLQLKSELGDFLNAGEVLYTLVDLNKVWAQFAAYQDQLNLIALGDSVRIEDQSTGLVHKGTVSFVSPVVDPSTRSAEVRVVLPNAKQTLKPGSVLKGELMSSVQPDDEHSLTVPRSAVLWTGKRSVVYVEHPDHPGAYALREIELGKAFDDRYLVQSGLMVGERVVTHGAFKVDAAAQLNGSRSMMQSSMHQEASASTVERTVQVSGNCEMCKARIEGAAQNVFGVSAATWDASSQVLSLSLDTLSTSVPEVSMAVSTAGHDTALHPAPDEIYDELPGCCLYARTLHQTQ